MATKVNGLAIIKRECGKKKWVLARLCADLERDFAAYKVVLQFMQQLCDATTEYRRCHGDLSCGEMDMIYPYAPRLGKKIAHIAVDLMVSAEDRATTMSGGGPVTPQWCLLAMQDLCMSNFLYSGVSVRHEQLAVCFNAARRHLSHWQATVNLMKRIVAEHRKKLGLPTKAPKK